jgi:hypothetical protein
MTVYFKESIGGYPLPKYYYLLDNSSVPISIGDYPSFIFIRDLSEGTHRIAIVAKGFESDNSANIIWSAITNVSAVKLLPVGPPTSLSRYCDIKNCQKEILYKQLKTGGNDTSVTAKMKYAQYTRGPVGKCTKTLDSNGNIIG